MKRYDPAMPGPVPSPCVDVCAMDSRTGWCRGCWRTLDEIAVWSSLDDATKRMVWAALPARAARSQAAAGDDSG